MSQIPTGPNIDVNTAVVTPIDRIRWGPIIAGLFAALAILALLVTLGSAVGLSTYDFGDRARSYAVGAGIWGVISMLIAFFVGGWLAARSSALRGYGTAVLNGAMVWALGIALLAFFLGGLGTAARHSMQAADGRVIYGTVRNDTELTQTQPHTQMTQEDLRTARRTAWGGFIALALGLGAAALGGWLGASDWHERRHMRDRSTTGRTDVPPVGPTTP